MTTTSRAETRKRGTNMSENTTTTTTTTTAATIDQKTMLRWMRVLSRSDATARNFARRLAMAAARQAVESGRLGYANAVHAAFRQLSTTIWAGKFARFMALVTGGRVLEQDAKGRITMMIDYDAAACVQTSPDVFKATGERFGWREDAEKAKAGKRAGRDWLRAAPELNFDEVQAAPKPDGKSDAEKRLAALRKIVQTANKHREKWIGTRGGKELAEAIRVLTNELPGIFAPSND